MTSYSTIVTNKSDCPIFVSVDDTEGSSKRKLEEMLRIVSGEAASGYIQFRLNEYEQTGGFGFAEVFPGYSKEFVRGNVKDAFVTIYYHYSLPPRVPRGIRLACAGKRVQEDTTILFDEFNQVMDVRLR
ncbi:unnamed protein product [Caenorhabditis auriculariae]|uniref:Uncharacterized protein n=1 Tax=Caenorhabditis auriculariae TaxID=2777116 RepID=A0A8S1GTH9_9PELO|nr:unnamed protein product [Caenorhabditis auriculariae]